MWQARRAHFLIVLVIIMAGCAAVPHSSVSNDQISGEWEGTTQMQGATNGFYMPAQLHQFKLKLKLDTDGKTVAAEHMGPSGDVIVGTGLWNGRNLTLTFREEHPDATMTYTASLAGSKLIGDHSIQAFGNQFKGKWTAVRKGP